MKEGENQRKENTTRNVGRGNRWEIQDWGWWYHSNPRLHITQLKDFHILKDFLLWYCHWCKSHFI